MVKLSKLLRIIDDNLLHILLCFFIFLVPLLPKKPFMIVNYTYIAIRIEDFYIAFLVFVYSVQLIRKKVTINKRFLKPFLLFWLVVLVSYLWGYFVVHTISSELRNVGFLHFARRVQYMIIFFIAASSVKSVSNFMNYLLYFITSIYMVLVYGLGQRFFGLPSISTMNPEYSKGRILMLTPEARINSTFGGHYDYATFLVFSIPIILGLFFVLHHKNNNYLTLPKFISKIINYTNSKLKKLAININQSRQNQSKNLVLNFKNIIQIIQNKKIHLLFAGTLIILLLAYSVNTSGLLIILFMLFWLLLFLLLINYQLVLILFLIALISIYNLVLTESRISFIAYILSTPLFLIYFRKFKYLVIILVLSLTLFFTNKNIVDRFNRTFQVKRFLVNELTGDLYVVQQMKIDELPAGSSILVQLDPKSAKSLSGKKTPEQITEEELAKQQIIKKANKSAKKKYGDQTASIQFTEKIGVAPDISFATRLNVEWPRAINSFKKNIFIGTGPSSITEATDNDYLRWLGETGLFGFILFVYILYIIVSSFITAAKQLPSFITPLFYAPIFSLFGLLVNASYIDVFEASKIAFMIWFIFGIYIGLIGLLDQKVK